LKIISRVMYQTAGRVDIAGRVGALIEVRAGLSPLLTGRENIFLTGSIMGLKRRDVARRFDEIVAFAELGDAIDRQVKYYSSGMQMRLGFGVAAHLEPDVLLVDEVLAVGDATFQQRCLDRIRQVLNEGTTLLFVSHDLAAVEATCANGVWLQNGAVHQIGPTREVLTAYRGAVEGEAKDRPHIAGVLRVPHVETSTPDGPLPKTGGPLNVDLTLDSDESCRAWGQRGRGDADLPAEPGTRDDARARQNPRALLDPGAAAAARALLRVGRDLQELDQRPGASALAAADRVRGLRPRTRRRSTRRRAALTAAR
jgi:ABC-type polysaccharide/polyol phosphate transport system ATPase subunit